MVSFLMLWVVKACLSVHGANSAQPEQLQRLLGRVPQRGSRVPLGAGCRESPGAQGSLCDHTLPRGMPGQEVAAGPQARREHLEGGGWPGWGSHVGEWHARMGPHRTLCLSGPAFQDGFPEGSSEPQGQNLPAGL